MRRLLALLVLSLGSSASAVTESSLPDALVAYRAEVHARQIKLCPIVGGSLEPDLMPQREILADWQLHHPAEAPRVDAALAHVTARRARLDTLGSSTADVERFAALDSFYDAWQATLNSVTDSPWASYDWGRVFGRDVARMELRLAEHLHVDVARVFTLFDHALPSAGGVPALLTALAKPSSLAEVPLYSSARVKALIEHAGSVSMLLKETLARANAGVPTRYELWQSLMRVAGLPTVTASPRAIYNFTFPRHGYTDPNRPRDPFVYAGDYARAIRTFDLIRANARRMDHSPLRTAIVDAARSLGRAMYYEMLTLPARADAAEAVGPREWSWGGVRWIDRPVFEGRPDSKAEWTKTLRGFKPHGARRFDGDIADANDQAVCRAALATAKPADPTPDK